MDDLEQLAIKKEFERFQQAIGSENDPTMLVLRAHLYSENLLERLINFKLPRGDKIIESANLSYHQKLVLVESLDCLPDSVVSVLRNLNKLRNQCAHELDKKIADGDVMRVGGQLGRNFTRMKREAKFEGTVLLRKVIDYVCGFLSAICNTSEYPELLDRPKQSSMTTGSTRTARKPAAG